MSELIRTTKGTTRLMDSNGMLEDLNIGIVETYRYLNYEQQNDLYNFASTKINESIEQLIRELV